MTLAKLPPTPVTTDQVPVPVVGLFPANAVLVTLQSVSWSGPALAVVGLATLVIVTSSKVGGHPLLNCQRNTALVPAGTPVTVVVADEVLVTVTPGAPDIIIHVPVTEGGFTAAIVKTELSHWVMSDPASAAGGGIP